MQDVLTVQLKYFDYSMVKSRSNLGLHQFQILPTLQVPSTAVKMYSQVQVPMRIRGNTIECAVKINFVFVILA